LNDLIIEDGKSKIFDAKADINEGDDGDTIQFKIRNKFDVYAVERGTNIGATIDLNGQNTFKTYTINAGKFKISEDTSNPSNQYVLADTDNVKVLVAKVDLDQPVKVDSIRLYVDNNTNIAAHDLNGDGDNIDN